MDTIDISLKRYIDKAVLNDSLSSAYIFEGAAGSGRMELAIHAARSLLCTADDRGSRPCGSCHACHLTESGNHPDITVLSHSNLNSISVRDIRTQIVEDIEIRPYYGGKKIYIIPEAEIMTTEAQNALLKTIEEPPEYAIIILIVKNRELLLQTVRSRCVILSFKAEPEYRAEDEAVATQFEIMDNIISGQISFDTVYIMDYAKELSSVYSEYIPELLTHMERVCRDALLYKTGALLTDNPMTGYIEKTSVISYEGLERILNAIKKARHDMLLNVAAETVMDCLLLKVKQACAKPV